MENKTFDRSNCDPLFDEVLAYAQEQKRVTASASTEQTALSDKSMSREY